MRKVLHLGLGRFHRGHQAYYFEKLKAYGHDWEITSCSMRSAEARDELREANFQYPVIELSEKDQNVVWVNSITEALSCPDDFPKVLETFLEQDLKLVTLTVTEKGYSLNPQGELDLKLVSDDVKNPDHPKTAVGILSLGLKKRAEKNLPPLTILSCDNLRENGHKLEKAVRSYFQALDWTLPDVAFPNTMVDRIVPALSEEKIQELQKEFKLPHSHLIATEAFTQWVIEDKFISEKPSLFFVGVQFVPDVRPFEEMKLKLLNASHSFLAYAGLNRGYQFVHEVIQDPIVSSEIEKLMLEEVIPTLEVPAGVDLKMYAESLVKRFKNEKLPHQLKQIAMDGSQKIPQRFLSTLNSSKLKKRETLIKGLSEWTKYVFGMLTTFPDELQDPWAKEMKSWPLDSIDTWSEVLFKSSLFTHVSSDVIALIKKDLT